MFIMPPAFCFCTAGKVTFVAHAHIFAFAWFLCIAPHCAVNLPLHIFTPPHCHTWMPCSTDIFHLQLPAHHTFYTHAHGRTCGSLSPSSSSDLSISHHTLSLSLSLSSLSTLSLGLPYATYILVSSSSSTFRHDFLTHVSIFCC